MLKRRLEPTLHRLLDSNPAVALIGPRQVGKTTLALEVARDRHAVYLDLELPSDRAKISRGFHTACEDLRPTRRFVVHAGDESFPLAKGIRAVTLQAMMELVARSR